MFAGLAKWNTRRKDLVISSNAIAFTVYAAIICTLFWPTVSSMIELWGSTSSQHHGFFVAPAVIWMALSGRRPRSPAVIWPQVSIGIIFISAIWLAGDAANANILKQFAFIGMITLGVVVFFGPGRTKEWALPLLLLFLMVPFGDSFSPALQMIAAHGSVMLLNLIGVEATLVGALIITSGGPFLVAEACAGLNFLLAAILIASLIAWRATPVWTKQAVFIFCAAFVAILTNIVRATLVIALDNYAEGRFSISADHLFAGWILYAIVLLVFITAAHRMLMRNSETDDISDNTIARSDRFSIYALAFLLAPLIAANLYASRFSGNALVYGVMDDISPIRASGWRLVPNDTLWPISFPSADAQVVARYVSGNTTAQIGIGYYIYDRSGAEIGDHESHSLPPGWIKIDQKKEKLYVFGTQQLLTTTILSDLSGRSFRAITVYWLGSSVYSHKAGLKFSLMQEKLIGRSPSGGSIVIIMPEHQGLSSLNRLLSDLEPLELWLERIEKKAAR